MSKQISQQSKSNSRRNVMERFKEKKIKTQQRSGIFSQKQCFEQSAGLLIKFSIFLTFPARFISKATNNLLRCPKPGTVATLFYT